MKRSPLARKTPLRAKPPARVERERAPLVLVPRPADARRPVMALAKAPAVPCPKEDRHSSEAWRRAVAEIPCVFCSKPAQAAHRNVGKGLALKTDDCLTAALCPEHHSEIDQGKNLTREQRRAELDRAIVLTLRALVHAGRVVLA
ncbi:MAG TPA: hypothetical protein VNV16_01210 [Methylibium sp.]|nr:hypothetical protein [Methylibium sp.]